MNPRQRELAARFAELVARPDAEIPLDEAALVLAAHARPGLDVGAQLACLDELAAQVRDPTLDALRALLFDELGFRGNREAYYDPANSFLDVVLDRRTGIPITLSLVVIELGRRLGVALAGVGMPGHFLVRDLAEHTVFVDAFDGGRRLDVDGCVRLFHTVHGARAAFQAEFLDPVPRAAIVGRMLANLRTIYAQSSDVFSLAWVARLRTRLPGADAACWRELGVVAGKVGSIDESIAAFETAAELDPSRRASDRRDADVQRARLN